MLLTEQSVWKWITIASLGIAGAWLRLPNPIQILLWLMLFDIVSGLIAAVANWKLNSSVMLKGLCMKAVVFPVLATLHLVEAPLKLSFEFETVAAIFFIVMEGMSIIENAARAGLPIPTFIVKAFAKAKIQTSNRAEIEREFSGGDYSKMSLIESSGIVKTPDSSPDLKVAKTVAILEEQHVTPVPPATKFKEESTK